MIFIMGITIIILVVFIAIYTGIHLAPVIIRFYLILLASLVKILNHPTHTSQKEIKHSNLQINQIDSINYVHNFRQFVDRVNKPVKKSDITNFNNGSSDDLDGSCLNMPPEPIIKLIDNPIPNAIHETNVSQAKKPSQPKGNDTTLTRTALHFIGRITSSPLTKGRGFTLNGYVVNHWSTISMFTTLIVRGKIDAVSGG